MPGHRDFPFYAVSNNFFVYHLSNSRIILLVSQISSEPVYLIDDVIHVTWCVVGAGNDDPEEVDESVTAERIVANEHRPILDHPLFDFWRHLVQKERTWN